MEKLGTWDLEREISGCAVCLGFCLEAAKRRHIVAVGVNPRGKESVTLPPWPHGHGYNLPPLRGFQTKYQTTHLLFQESCFWRCLVRLHLTGCGFIAAISIMPKDTPSIDDRF